MQCVCAAPGVWFLLILLWQVLRAADILYRLGFLVTNFMQPLRACQSKDFGGRKHPKLSACSLVCLGTADLTETSPFGLSLLAEP